MVWTGGGSNSYSTHLELTREHAWPLSGLPKLESLRDFEAVIARACAEFASTGHRALAPVDAAAAAA
jgi:hypothetical protein